MTVVALAASIGNPEQFTFCIDHRKTDEDFIYAVLIQIERACLMGGVIFAGLANGP